jgi:hypothetical protein
MQNITAKIATASWQNITEEMHNKGFAIIPMSLLLSNARN